MSSSGRDFARTHQAPQPSNHQEEKSNTSQTDKILPNRRWEYQEIPRVLHKGSETRNTKRHQEQTEHLPAIELRGPVSRRARANAQCHADDATQSKCID